MHLFSSYNKHSLDFSELVGFIVLNKKKCIQAFDLIDQLIEKTLFNQFGLMIKIKMVLFFIF